MCDVNGYLDSAGLRDAGDDSNSRQTETRPSHTIIFIPEKTILILTCSLITVSSCTWTTVSY